MFKQSTLSSTPRLFSTAGTFGEIQVIATADNVLLDVQSRNYDTAGHLHTDHSLAVLSLPTAIRIRDLLDAAIRASKEIEPRQAPLWSDATVASIAARVTSRRAA